MQKALATLALAAVLGGCQSYRPVDPPVPGSTVRVHVPVSSALADRNAPTQSVSVVGQVVSVTDSLVLAIRTRNEYGAFREIIRYDTLRLDRAELVSVDVEEFSSGRTTVLGVALAAGITGVVLAAIGFGGGSGGHEGDGGGGTTTQGSVVSAVASLIGWLIGS